MAVARTFAEQADHELAEVQDDPVARVQFARAFFTHDEREHIRNYADSELAFMDWEVRRGCLNSMNAEHPGSPWWRAVNGGLLRDAREAHLLFDAGEPSTAGLASSLSVQRWQEFMERPSARTFYLAHNRSVAAGYLAHVESAGLERGHEQKLMNLVLYRVLFTQAIVDEQWWALGWVSRLISRFVSPTSPMVNYVVHRRDLYPDSYPLSEDDCKRLDRSINRLGNILVSLVDLAVISYRLPRLYEYAATTLDLPELRNMARHYWPCYPWGLKMHANELEAITSTDKPSLIVRFTGFCVHGAAE
jgi:hypothetical protein